MKTNFVRRSVLVFFMLLLTSAAWAIYQCDYELPTGGSKYVFHYVGGSNCCNAPYGAAFVEKYTCIDYYFFNSCSYDYGYYIPAADAASIYGQYNTCPGHMG